MWPVESASKGAVASGQQRYTEANRLWHSLIRWTSSGSLMNMVTLFRFRLFVFLMFSSPVIYLFLLLLVIYVFSKFSKVWFCCRDHTVCICSLFSQVCFMICLCKLMTAQWLWKPEPMFSFGLPAVTTTADLTCTPLKLLLQYILHWYSADKITAEPCGYSENWKLAACIMQLVLRDSVFLTTKNSLKIVQEIQ